MNGRTRSFPALESFDGNWVISNPKSEQQVIYAVSNGKNNHRVAFQDLPQRRDDRKAQSEYGTKRARNKNQRNQSADRTRTRSTNGNANDYQSLRNDFRRPLPRVVVLCKADGEFGFTMRQVPSSAYGGQTEANFTPTSRVPALQRLNVIDPGSLADRAGLRHGDYIIEVNDQNVTCSTHLHVVQLIKNSTEALKLKVVEGVGETNRFSTTTHRTQPQRVRYARKTDVNHNTLRSSGNGLEDVRQRKYERRHPLANGSIYNSVHLSHLHPGHASSVSTVKHQVHHPRSNHSAVANIRLSRFSDNDRVYYDSKRRNDLRESQSATPEVGSKRLVQENRSSVSSVGSVRPRSADFEIQPQISVRSSMSDGSYDSKDGRAHSRQDAATTTSEAETQISEDELSQNGSSRLANNNSVYDLLRPQDVPFDTDEGYVRLDGFVDYVEQSNVEEVDVEQGSVDQQDMNFIEMAEKVRLMYLRQKSEHQ